MKCVNEAIGPMVVTEKSCVLKDSLGKVSLFASPSMTKEQVKSVFLRKFSSVKVLSVNSISVRGKVKRFKGRLGKRSERKKFILTIEGGAQVDLSRL